MYLPLVGLAIAVVFEARRATALHPRAQSAAVAAGVAIVLVFAAVAWRQVAVWHDSLALKIARRGGHRAQRRRAPGPGRGPGARRGGSTRLSPT